MGRCFHPDTVRGRDRRHKLPRGAPARTWEGPLGRARKILEALMAYRITAGSFEEMVVEVEAFDGEFERVAEVEWAENQDSRGEPA